MKVHVVACRTAIRLRLRPRRFSVIFQLRSSLLRRNGLDIDIMVNFRFPATRWTLVVAAGRDPSAQADEAVGELCRAYWFPVYAFVRRSGNSPEAAEDLTQEFFTHFIETRDFARADQARGRFRSFLLTSVKHFLIDQPDRRNAEKRGGGRGTVPLDFKDAEQRYPSEFADNDTPERVFEREWVAALLSRVNDDVREVLRREGRSEQFDQLKGYLPGGEEPVSYAESAARLGTSEGALKVAVHRLRRRYREVFRAEISHLVSDQQLIDDEIRHLLQILRN